MMLKKTFGLGELNKCNFFQLKEDLAEVKRSNISIRFGEALPNKSA